MNAQAGFGLATLGLLVGGLLVYLLLRGRRDSAALDRETALRVEAEADGIENEERDNVSKLDREAVWDEFEEHYPRGH